jgi:hypothetical protein
MNKQLKLLAEQAGYTPLPGFDFANELQEVFLAKFAELIVRECANIADTAEPYKSNDLILKHFGVQE